MSQQTFIIDGAVDTRITVEEVDGDLVFTVEVLETDGNIADLQGLFFDFNDESLLGNLSVTGPDVSNSSFDANSVDNLGKGLNMKGHHTNKGNAFDAGIAFGTPGIGKDDIQTTTFTLSSDGEDLTLSDIEGARFGVRYTSVGEEDGPREDSLKIVDVNDAPAAQPEEFFVEYADTVSVDVAANDGAFADPSTIVVDGATVDLGTATHVAGEVEYEAKSIAYDTMDSSASDPFDYTIGNGSGDASSTTVTANVIDPLRETNTDDRTTANGQDLSLTLSTEDRTYNDSSFVEVDIASGGLGDQTLNVSFVLDASGSVGQEWSEEVQAVQNALDDLRAEFSGSSADINIQLVRFAEGASQQTYSLWDAALNDIAANTLYSTGASGVTNYEAALDLAVTFFTGKDGDDNFMLFASDGYPNRGGSYSDEVNELNGFNVSITAVGFGDGINAGTLDGIDNTGGSEVVASAADLSGIFATSPLFPAELVDFSLKVGGVEVADENDLTSLGNGDYELNDTLTALLNSLGDTNQVDATAVFDTDGDLGTIDDQVMLMASTSINGTDGTDIVFA